jgi:hypothetical protein
MKRILILLCLSACCGQVLSHQNPPPHFRISVQYFSLPLRTLNDLMADEQNSDAILHTKVTALSKEGKAKLLDSNMIVCRSGQKATIESIREEIYPTEYDPPDLPYSTPTNGPEVLPIFPVHFRPIQSTPSAFETRNTGMTLTVEATVESPSLVRVCLFPEWVALNGLSTWMEHSDHWGNADFRMPIFETWRANTSMNLKPGTFALVSSITPKRALLVPFLETRILLFVRADLLGTVLE